MNPAERLAASPQPPWSWRVASWLATVAAGGLLAVVLAYWGWRVWGPVAAPVPPPVTPEHWTEAIVSAPLFGRPSAAAANAEPAARTLGGDARLLGVFAERDGQGYALFRFPERGPVLVKSGQEIAKDVRLESVRPDGVRIRDHGDVRDIVLRAPPVVAAASAVAPERTRVAAARPGCTAPAGYKGPVYRLNAELLSGIASQPDSWKALLVPTAGGLAVRDESGFAVMLGMKAGDRMAVANGIALAGIDDVLTAVVKPLLASQPVRVTGTRDGRAAEWLFVNAGACPG